MSKARSSIKAQAAEARRQYAMMQGVYPKMVEAGVITRNEIDCDLKLMADVVETLEWLERNERVVRAAVAKAGDATEGATA